MSASNGSVFDLGTMRATVVRLLPSYQAPTARKLSIVQIVLGVLLVVLGGVAFTLNAFTSVGGTAVVTSLSACIAGIFGIVTSFQRTVWAITGYLLLSIVSLIMAFALIIASAIGMTLEGGRPSHAHESARSAIDVIVMLGGVAVAASMCWSTILCGTNLFYGCCKQTSGVKYVKDPNRNDSDATSPVSPMDTGEPEDYDLSDGNRYITDFTQSTDSAVLS